MAESLTFLSLVRERADAAHVPVPERTSIEPRNDTNHMALSLESGTYEEVKEYLERNGCIVTGRPGDDHRLMANAGLLLPSTLALHLGLPQLVQEHLDLGDAPGWANTGDKMLTGGLCAGWWRLH